MMNTKNVKVIISNKSYPVSIEMRPLWRICLIIVSIVVVSGKKKYLDLNKVNILVWMLIRKNRWEEYQEYLEEKGIIDKLPLISVDTSTYKAIEYSISKNLIRLDAGRLCVTELGEKVFSLLDLNDIMSEERLFLKMVGKKLTNQKVKDLTGGVI